MASSAPAGPAPRLLQIHVVLFRSSHHPCSVRMNAGLVVVARVFRRGDLLHRRQSNFAPTIKPSPLKRRATIPEQTHVFVYSANLFVYDFAFLPTTSSRLVPKSFSTTMAALRPGCPVTEPPGAVVPPV